MERLYKTLRTFSLAEKIIFSLFVALLIGSCLYLIGIVNRYYSIQVPIRGGSLTEGVIGHAGYINPVLAATDSAGRDLTELMYSGLLKATPDGTLIPELAESYDISADGLTYTFVLKNKIYFHDNTPITADDVIFTIQKVQDPALRIANKTNKTNWDGITIKKIDNRTVSFTLPKPYAPFLQNTTLGIIPKHIWKNANDENFIYSQFNFEPIGSGPYKLYSVERDSSGVPQNYNLVPFNRYPLGSPYIEHLKIKTFPNEKSMIQAYQNGDIQSIYGISPQVAKSIVRGDSKIYMTPLPRIFGIFFNQNEAPVLANKEVRQALQLATDRQAVIDSVLGGYGVAITGPISPGSLPSDVNLSAPIATTSIEAAIKVLTTAGWAPDANGIMQKKVKKDVTTLQFSISTSDTPELVQAANMVKVMWQKIGADVDVKIFEAEGLNANVIRPRKYEALLFGEIIGRDLDFYAFWHSSGRLAPGLNITQYVNIKADKILEKARTITDTKERLDQYALFEKEIRNDIPAIFLYAPNFIYILPKNIQGVKIGSVTIPSERFSGVSQWYIDTENVWKIFVKK